MPAQFTLQVTPPSSRSKTRPFSAVSRISQFVSSLSAFRRSSSRALREAARSSSRAISSRLAITRPNIAPMLSERAERSSQLRQHWLIIRAPDDVVAPRHLKNGGKAPDRARPRVREAKGDGRGYCTAKDTATPALIGNLREICPPVVLRRRRAERDSIVRGGAPLHAGPVHG